MFLHAAAAGFFAALSRSVGVLVAVPFAIEALGEVFANARHNQLPLGRKCVMLLGKAAMGLLIPLGTCVYLYINYRTTGDALRFLTVQSEHWHQSFGWFFDTVRYTFDYAFVNIRPEAISTWIPQILAVALSLCTMLFGAFKLRSSYGLYALFYLLVIYAPTWLLSGARYTMLLFPMYMIWARSLKNNAAFAIVCCLSFVLNVVCTAMFALGYHIV